MKQRPFIPTWLDDLGISSATFRIYGHFLRSADNQTGVAWPSYTRMMEITGMSKSTIRRCIVELEARGLIKRIGKPFGGSCRYQVFPIVPPEGQMEPSNSSTTGTIEDATIVSPANRNNPSGDTSIVPPEGQEGSPRKVLQRRESNTLLVEQIWNMTPPKGRERSSKKQLAAALRKLPKGTADETILAALEAWNRSDAWTKDAGQFVPGIHRWVNDGRWETIPEPTNGGKPSQAALDDAERLLGRRAAYLAVNRRGYEETLEHR